MIPLLRRFVLRRHTASRRRLRQRLRSPCSCWRRCGCGRVRHSRCSADVDVQVRHSLARSGGATRRIRTTRSRCRSDGRWRRRRRRAGYGRSAPAHRLRPIHSMATVVLRYRWRVTPNCGTSAAARRVRSSQSMRTAPSRRRACARACDRRCSGRTLGATTSSRACTTRPSCFRRRLILRHGRVREQAGRDPRRAVGLEGGHAPCT